MYKVNVMIKVSVMIKIKNAIISCLRVEGVLGEILSPLPDTNLVQSLLLIRRELYTVSRKLELQVQCTIF